MSNIIPPLLSDSPPPPPSPDEEDDDEFGDFAGVIDCSYSCDNLSLPQTPEHSPTKVSILNGLDINFNGDEKVINEDGATEVVKDFHDKRKGHLKFLASSFDFKNDVAITDNFGNNDLNYESDGEKTPAAVKNETCSLKSDLLLSSKELKEEESPVAMVSSEMNLQPANPIIKILSQDECDISNEIPRNVPNTVFDVPDVESKNVYNSVFCHELESELDDQVNDLIKNRRDKQNESVTSANNTLNIRSGQSQCNENCHSEKMDNHPITFDDFICITNSHKGNSSRNTFDFENAKVNQDEFEDLDMCKTEIADNQDFFKESKTIENDIFGESMEDQVSRHSSQVQFEDNIKSDTFDDEFEQFTEFASSLKVEVSVDSNDQNLSTDQFTQLQSKDNVNSEDNDDEFAEFCSHNEEVADANSEDFGDFATAFEDTKSSEYKDSGDFNNISETACIKPVFLLMNDKEAFDKANIIVKEMFPDHYVTNEDYQNILNETSDLMFNQLHDITDTPALSYQWSKSSSQKMLLKSLNIDARNILYGPSWNPSMPKFAANLSLEPLEPIRTDSAEVQLQKQSPTLTGQQTSIEIPCVQFDWTSSGLTNPLDYLEMLVTSLDIISYPKSNISNTPSTTNRDLDDWDVWLKSVSKTPSGGPKQLVSSEGLPQIINLNLLAKAEASGNVISKSTLEEDDDFAPFQSSTVPVLPQIWPNTVPLRETYISNDISVNPKESTLDVEAWLQPTIVTPELRRKVLAEDTPNISTPDDVIEEKNDFDDFQAALPHTNSKKPIKNSLLADIGKEKNDFDDCEGTLHATKSKQLIKDTLVNDLLEENNYFDDFQTALPHVKANLTQEGKFNVASSISVPDVQNNQSMKTFASTDYTEPNLSTVKQKMSLSVANIEKNKTSILAIEMSKDDDEFTDFQYSTPVSRPPVSDLAKSINMNLNPIHHSLKPIHIPMKPLNDAKKPVSANQNLVDDPLKSINEPFKPTLELLTPIPTYKSTSAPTTNINWPDPGITEEDLKKFEVFTHPVQPKLQESVKMKEVKKVDAKSSSIDDEEWTEFISVKKLSPVHKLKTQERERMSSPDLPLSVFNLGNIQPTKQPIPVITPQGLVQTKLSSNSLNMSPKTNLRSNIIIPKPTYQIPPSTISQQYASQAYNFNNSSVNTASPNQKTVDDDDWGEFVSSPLSANGYPQPRQQTSQHNSWANSTPNIITNPHHFVQNGRGVIRNVSATNMSRKNVVPNLILPELDFVAPKGRTSTSKKK